MKELTRYKGKVTKFCNPPTPSEVILTEISTGKTVNTQILSNELVKRNIRQDDEFEVVITETANGTQHGEFHKIEKT